MWKFAAAILKYYSLENTSKNFLFSKIKTFFIDKNEYDENKNLNNNPHSHVIYSLPILIIAGSINIKIKLTKNYEGKI
jgi:hypothetical protein